SVEPTPIWSNRFLIVPVDSSAARMPLPGATSSRAVACIASLISSSWIPSFLPSRRRSGTYGEGSPSGCPPPTVEKPTQGDEGRRRCTEHAGERTLDAADVVAGDGPRGRPGHRDPCGRASRRGEGGTATGAGSDRLVGSRRLRRAPARSAVPAPHGRATRSAGAPRPSRGREGDPR